ncbi:MULTISPECIES: hypothetical protein [unclassified Kitasatospora]|uniref:hypothetical protein n=1 Tax=unclassified Kitasatospora TaxID=2633591 RepID=UPI000709DD22|nr:MULTISPECIES: hypothetical protein [unclassified Kitasatospora]KQV17163.1 hypothetical protein ASC99_26510 [Kitasatospora sp. Root107]KRB69990.1 hypothetical protein ASE03_25350 [Kitasatospora sp. Root187]
MADNADLVCFRCKLVLPLGWFWNIADPRVLFLPSGPRHEDPVATQAVWRFLAEHVYHPIELLGENSPRHSDIDDDFTTVDDENRTGEPTLAEYAGEWAGRRLALTPRPLCEAIRAIATAAEDGCYHARHTLTPEDHRALRTLDDALDWPEPAGRPVTDDDVARRIARLHRRLDILDSAAPLATTPAVVTFIAESSQVLAPARELTLAALTSERDDYAPPALFDAERAIGLVRYTAWLVLP